MLTFEKGHYFAKIWMLRHPGVPMDVLASLHRRLPEGLWELSYRFRYYNDGKAHDSADRKSGYHGTFEDHGLSDEQLLSKVEGILQTIAVMMGQQYGVGSFEMDGVDCQTDEPALILHLLGQKSWAYFQAQEPDGSEASS